MKSAVSHRHGTDTIEQKTLNDDELSRFALEEVYKKRADKEYTHIHICSF